MKTWLTLLAVAFGSGAATQVDDYLTDKLRVDPLSSVIFAGLAGVVVYEVVERLVGLLLRIRGLRPLLDPRALFEGYWISVTTKNEKHYRNLINIFYETAGSGYSVTGTALDGSGELHASWSGSDIDFNFKESVVTFFYESFFLAPGQSEDIFGFANIKFHRTGSGTYTNGEGHIVDTGSNCAKYPLVLNRLSRREVRELIGKDDPLTQGEKRELIMKYCEAHPVF